MSKKTAPEAIESSGLPRSLELAIAQDDYVPAAEWGITTLVGPARIRVLKGRHGEKQPEDPIDSFPRFFGQLAHAIAEKHGKQIPGSLVEEPFWIRWPFDAPFPTVGGRPDLIDVLGKTIWDYKFGSYYRYMDGCPGEYIQQVQCYCALCRLRGIEIEAAFVLGVFRDWTASAARHRRDSCPPRPWKAYRLSKEQLDPDTCMKVLAERVRAHADAEKELPECTDEERWAEPARYAVYDLRERKNGDAKPKKAKRLLDTRERAEYYAKALNIPKDDVLIEYRPAEYRRCERFCPVAAHCEQFKRDQGGAK